MNDSQAAKDTVEKLMVDSLAGDGFHGMREIKPEAPNVEAIIPPFRSASKYHQKSAKTLPEEYDKFLSEMSDGTMLVAFGTTFSPDAKMVRSILEAAQAKSNFGFIISIKESFTTYKIVEEAALPNVLLRSFVPQVELLSDDRVFAFISHGGGNSIQESVYNGKPLIGCPLDAEQFGSTYRMQRIGIGISLSDRVSKDSLVAAIDRISPADSKER